MQSFDDMNSPLNISKSSNALGRDLPDTKFSDDESNPYATLVPCGGLVEETKVASKDLPDRTKLLI